MVRRAAITLPLIWLMAVNLRTLIFATPPLLPELRHDLGLSYSASGALTSVVLATIGLGSLPGAVLGARLGAQRTVTFSSLALGLAAAARLLQPQILWVFAGTIGLALCVAFTQPSMTVLIRRWYPASVPRVSGIYTNGILVGSTVGASATPLVDHLLGWQATFLVWAGVALAVGAVWAWLTPRDDTGPAPSRLLESIRDRRVWQILALLTFQNIAYFTAATWLPFLLHGQSPFYVSVVLLCLNLFPLPVLLLVTVLPWTYPLSTGYYAAAGVITLVGSVGLLLGLVQLAWLSGFLLGLGCGAAFMAALALPPLVAADETQASAFTALVFFLGYFLAFTGPILAGSIVDASGAITSAFWPSVGGAAMMALTSLAVPRSMLRKPKGSPC